MKLVLIVDDDHWWGQQHRRLLSRAGYRCVVVHSVAEALDAIDTELPAAIVLDFLLAGANGLQLLHELQSYADTHAIPVVVCSSVSDLQQELSSLEQYGVRVILDKTTMTPRRLTTAVKSVIV